MKRIASKAASLIGATILGLVVTTTAKASTSVDFPRGSVTVISPYAPGGINDIVARLLSSDISKTLKQPVVVMNRAGGGGAIGASELARAKPDGHTVMLGALGPLAVTKLINPSLPYDPRDFTPIIEVGRAPMILAVNAKLNINSVDELLDRIKHDPKKWNYGSAGIGSPQHLSGVLFNRKLGTELTHVAYRGSGPAAVALASGEIQVEFENLPPLLPHIQSGAIKPIAVLAPERMEMLPEVPTMKELGVTDLEVSGWYGFVAPPQTPPAVVRILFDATRAALDAPETKKRLVGFGIVKTADTGEHFGALIRSEYDRWKPVIDAVDAKTP